MQANECTSPDTDGAMRGGLHYGYCATCGWESGVTPDPMQAHEWMEEHRLAANARREHAAKWAPVAYCEGCEREDVSLRRAETLDGGAPAPTEWCAECVEAMPAETRRRYWPSEV